MKYPPIALLLILLVSSLGVGAVENSHAKIGFEIELAPLLATRLAIDAETNKVTGLDATEKTDGSWVAQTRGTVPDLDQNPWPLFQVTVDNVGRRSTKGFAHSTTDAKTVKSVAFVLQQRDSRIGLIEIVSGPLVYHDALRSDTFTAIQTLIQTFKTHCDNRTVAPQTKPGERDYFLWQDFQSAYNQRLAEVEFKIREVKPLFELQTVHKAAGDIYIECPQPPVATPIKKWANLEAAIEQLVRDVQNTNGIPLGKLAAQKIDWGDLPTHTDEWLKPVTAGAAAKASLSGIVKIWAAYLQCAKFKDPTANVPTVICDKKQLSPLPHVDVCALATEYWHLFPDPKGEQRLQLEGAIKKNIAQLMANSGFAKRFLKSDQDIDEVLLAPLRGDCKRWGTMAYADGSVVPPLRLRVTDPDVADIALGFALETRVRGPEASKKLLQEESDELRALIAELTAIIQPVALNCFVTGANPNSDVRTPANGVSQPPMAANAVSTAAIPTLRCDVLQGK